MENLPRDTAPEALASSPPEVSPQNPILNHSTGQHLRLYLHFLRVSTQSLRTEGT